MIRGLTNWIAQVAAVTGLSLQTMPERKGSSASAVLGIAGVVAVMVGVLSIAQGFLQAMTGSADPQVAMVLRSGADSEMMSGLGGPDTRLVAEAPGVARGDRGPLCSSELFVVINLPKRSTGTDANVPLRGVEPPAFEVRRGLQIVAGRPFAWGRNEIVVGAGAAAAFAGLDLGNTIEVGSSRWKVVGIFEERGGLSESEIWADAAMVQSAFRRGNSFQSVYARLETADAFSDFKDALSADPRLDVKVVRQSEFYAEQSVLIYTLIMTVGVFIAALMALGAVFGAVNTLYTAVSSRTREIATLRAMGFRGGPVVVSVLSEALLLAVVGGVVGGLAAYFAFNGYQAATMNWQSFSQVAFAFAVTPGLLVAGVILAVMIGMLGGLFPAFRAARMPVATALREL